MDDTISQFLKSDPELATACEDETPEELSDMNISIPILGSFVRLEDLFSDAHR
jgi:hypothetical protein